MNKLLLYFIPILLIPAALYAQYEEKQLIDLTYSLDENTIFWPTADTFELTEVFNGKTEKGYYYSANNFCSAEHGGTHIDAPVHFAKGKISVDKIHLLNLMGNAIMIDASEKCDSNRDYLFSVTDFKKWEKDNGTIPPGIIVLLRSGYGKYWPDKEKYMGTMERGEEAVEKLHFPGLDPEAAEWLVEERKIKAVGIDTPSIDYGQSTQFESHVILCKNKIPIFENVANMKYLPNKNFIIIALPMKIKGGSGGPARIIAIVD